MCLSVSNEIRPELVIRREFRPKMAMKRRKRKKKKKMAIAKLFAIYKTILTISKIHHKRNVSIRNVSET